MYDFSFADIARNLALAMRWTVGLSLVAFLGGGLLAGVLVLLRLSGGTLANRIVGGYVQVFQGTPLLLQLFLAYFGLALIGFETTALLAASVCLILYTAAYLSEIWRACVKAIDKGQWEAGESLALSFGEQMRFVILPQALRLGIAPTVGFLVQVVKATAVTSVIGFVEMTRAGQMITNATFQPFTVYGCVALLYFAICFPLSACSRTLERRFRC